MTRLPYSVATTVSLAALFAACTGTVDGPGGAGNSNSAASSPGGIGGSVASGVGGAGTTDQSAASTTTGFGGTSTTVDPSDSVASLPLHGAPLYTRFVRLTHEQWENSVRDLLRLSDVPGLSSSFQGDPPQGNFSNNERALFISGTLWGDYVRAAETLSEQLARDPTALAALGGNGDAATFIQNLGRRAFRRPLTTEELQRYQVLFDSGATTLASGDNFADGAQMVIDAFLQSPHFVYRSELGNDGSALSGYEIASKLSFLLRNTMPDDAMLDAAANGEFDSLAGVSSWAERLINEMPARDVMRIYNSELFGQTNYLSIDKAPDVFPNYSQDVNDDLEESEYLFLDYIFAEGMGLRDLLLSQTAFVNASIAPFYGVTAQGPSFAQVELGPERPGLFTRVGFLALNGTLRDPDPIRRGVSINHRILCSELTPPEGVVIPQLPAAMEGQTNRQRVDAHTGEGTCGASCHDNFINPVGFAFENFDALGQIRTMDAGQPVDTSGEYAFYDGLKAFNNAPELLTLIADNEMTHACYTAHLAEFALSRDLAENDRGLITYLQEISMSDTPSIKQLLMSIVQDPAFTNRSGGV